ncbi:c-type cytochrome [Arhodomonas sp. AD133]|uniref:c-type cytochrome n=1 Tax=Arhodomonas sp. AD133 TaxID=3415009 RepID=UPI003EB724D2
MRMRHILLLVMLSVVLGHSRTAASADIARGEYLVKVGNCAGCHTARGGADFAGGRAIQSPFGTFRTPNITPHDETGIGEWNRDEFWQALHNGERPDGAPIYPACPYPNYTRVRRRDVDAIFAYLRSVPAVDRVNQDHELDFPASVRAFVNVWQGLFFEPGTLAPQRDRGELWNRGAYLVKGLGHCSACHRARGALGARRMDDPTTGGRIHGWYAPSLHSRAEAGLQGWRVEDAAAFIRSGIFEDARMNGPMADVVFDSLQYLSGRDARAIAVYLTNLPDHDARSAAQLLAVREHRRRTMRGQGRAIYEEHCAECHASDGEGSVAAPALVGNRAVTLADPKNLVNVIRHGAYPASTDGNPRPFGMPPFYQLSRQELAAVITYIRTSWGNDASPVSTANVAW